MVVALILVFITIAVIEVPGLARKKLWRELIAVSVFLTIGFTLSLLQVLEVEVPSPNSAIKSLIEAIGRMVSK